MKRRHLTAAAAATMAVGMAALQLAPGMDVVNPPVQRWQTIEASVAVPAPVAAILARACRNCHSNETVVPWYGRFAPGSWLLTRDVNRARRAMNLSTWAVGPGRQPAVAAATLAAACADIRSDRMPLAPYRFMHPESRLTAGDKHTFCAWANRWSRDLVSRRAPDPDAAKAH